MNNKKNNHTLFSILILLGVILIILLLSVLYVKYGNIRKIESEDMHEYQVLTPLKANGENMNLCPKGCIRGDCNETISKKPGNCKYDFQCQYCQDQVTNMFYVEFNKEREILPLYEEEKHMNFAQQSLLNKSIESNNDYIRQLNNKLKKINS